MERHFSNRGEALAEVTAARTLVGRKHLAKPVSNAQAARRTRPQWFSQPAEVTRLPKKKRVKQNDTAAPLL